MYGDSVRQESGLTSSPIILNPAQDVLPGWELKLDTTQGGYWFMIKDKTDPCGFALVGNESGVIYTARRMR